MGLRAIAVLAACTMLAGCAGLSYAMNVYAGVPVTPYEMPAADGGPSTTYRIFDKPAENRLMITPSLGASAGAGMVHGLTFGTVNPIDTPVVFRDAAQGYLDSTGRTCRTIDITLIAQPQYEVRYDCSVPPLAPPPLPPAAPAKKR